MLTKLRVELAKMSGLRFADVYGSVLESDRVHDVNVGVFFDETATARQKNTVDALSATRTAAVGVPVDVRVLNDAPVSFLYHVLRGRLVLCRDETFLTDC